MERYFDMSGNALLLALKSAARGLPRYGAILAVATAAWLLLYALAFLLRECLKEFSGAPRLKKGRVFFSGLLEGAVYTVLRLPKIFVAFVLLFSVSTLFELGSSVRRYIDGRKQVRELTAVVGNLSRIDDVARVTVLDDDLRTEKGSLAKRYLIEVLALDGSVLARQTVAMEGEEFFIDSVNLNFDYSEIGAGRQLNIAYPYRVYTEKIPPAYGVSLTCMYDEEQVPVLFLLTDDEVYGIEKHAYAARLRELVSLLSADDGTTRAELGIRSFNGNAVHARLSKGDVCIIRAEGSGGISLHRQAF